MIILLHLVAILVMVGIIWFVQIVHYPLFSQVGEHAFSLYETHHVRLTTYVVAPAMLTELATALWLLWQRPEGIMAIQVWLGIGLLAMIWFSTLLIQAPMHDQLTQGFNAAIHDKLVTSNWLRTITWSARGLVALWIVQGFVAG
jgi:uncharacterized membrane protein